MFLKQVSFYAFSLCSLAITSAQENVEMTPYGALRLEQQTNIYRRCNFPSGGVRKFSRHFFRSKSASPSCTEGTYILKTGIEAEFVATLQENSKKQYVFKSQIKNVPKGKFKKFGFSIALDPLKSNIVLVDSKEIKLSKKFKKHGLYSANAKQLRFWIGPTGYTISGKFKVMIQDLRNYHKHKGLRIVIEDCNQFKLSREQPEAIPFDMSGYANRALKDRISNDGKGGWTDQGPNQDLDGIKLGKKKYAGIDFNIIDPVKNKNRSTLVISGPEYAFPQNAKIALDSNQKFEYLYLLHASAWAPKNKQLGTFTVSYSDGSKQEFPIIRGKNCGDTWNPVISYDDAKVGLRLEKKNNACGLYVSAFHLNSKKKVVQIKFNVPNYIWGIAGISFGNWPLPESVSPPYEIVAGKEWKVIENAGDIVPNSPLDFSKSLDAPAGKHGWVIANKTGNFEFEKTPGCRIRFIGTNLCQTAVRPSHAETDRLVKRLAAEGFNAVRLHQHESQLIDYKFKDSLHFNAKRMDSFDYLVHRLREAGIYITMDILSSRDIRLGDNIAECKSGSVRIRKALTPVSPSALKNWKEYARRFLSRKNAYTGKSILEDPAFIFFTLDNEGCLFQWWKRTRSKYIVAAYHAWLKKNGKYSKDTAAKRDDIFNHFLKECQQIDQREKLRYLRKELGVKFLLNNHNNLSNDPRVVDLRNDFPMVDMHLYVNHPVFPVRRFKLPSYCAHKSELKTRLFEIGRRAASRISGKPFVLTEINWCNPTLTRAEMGPIFGACSSLQGWDAMFSFAWTHHVEDLREQRRMTTLNLANDPLVRAGWRILYFLFRRGDVATAQGYIELKLDSKAAFKLKEFPESFRRLVAFTKIGLDCRESKEKGISLKPEEFPAGLPANAKKYLRDLKIGKQIKSSTGELVLQPERSGMKLITPKSECLVLDKGTLAGDFFSASKVNTFTTLSLHSLDGKKLAKSSKMLLIHLTDAASSGTTFADASCHLMTNYGKLPLLVKRGIAKIALNAPRLKVTRILLNGSSAGDISVKSNNSKSVFSIDSSGISGHAIIYYLITR